MLVIIAVQSFCPSYRYASNTITHVRIRGGNLGSLYAENPSRKQAQGGGLLQILNSEVSDVILERLNQKLNGGSQSKLLPKKKKPYESTSTASAATDGLSKFHRSILATTSRRQRCVTGQYPLKITIEENPTRKWLSSGSSSVATSQMLVNGTSVERSLASYDRFQWLDDHERTTLHEGHSLFSLELLAEINVKKPGYLNVMPACDAGFAAKREKDDSGIWKNRYKLTYDQRHRDDDDENYENGVGIFATSKREQLERMFEAEKERVWITGFSLTKQSGEIHFVDVESGAMGHINKQTASAIRWPNEVNEVPIQNYSIESETKQSGLDTGITKEDALLVSDGFLVPGRDNGGLYVVNKPGHDRKEWRICLAGGNGVDGLLSRLETRRNSGDVVSEDGWFYHRSIWIDLTGDGRQSVLTARAKRPSLLKKQDGGIASEQVDPSLKSTKAQLVWLERPQPHSFDETSGTPLDKDGLVFDAFSPKHTPWKVRVLDEGPDVMFCVADMDSTGKS